MSTFNENTEHEDRPEFDDNGEPIIYIEEDVIPDEFASEYDGVIDLDVQDDSFYETVWGGDASSVATLAADDSTTGEEVTDPLEVEVEQDTKDTTENDGILEQANEDYNNAVDILIDVLTQALAQGEITEEMNASILDAQGTKTKNEQIIKEICNVQEDNSILKQLADIKANMVAASVDDIIDILTDGGTKPWLYMDDDNNILVDMQAIPQLLVLTNKLNLIATGGDGESELKLTPEFMKLVSDKIVLDAKKIELNGSININKGLFKVLPNGRTQIGGLTGHIIDDVERAQLEINTSGTLYSVSKTVDGVYAKLSEGYLQFVNGNQVYKITAAGPNTTSDIRLKDNITNIDERFANLMLGLQSISYNMKDNKGIENRKNVGFSAQQVEQLMKQEGITYDEFAALNKNEDGIYSLNYSQFIPLNTYMIQHLYKRINELEKRINQLENI